MRNHYSTFKLYFDTCEQNDITPTFEGFIITHKNHIKSTLDPECNNYDNLLSAFISYAKSHGLKHSKGFAKKAWMQHVEEKEDTSGSKKNKLVLCSEQGESKDVEGTWIVNEENMIDLFNQERAQAVDDVGAARFITECRYLLLSFVVEVPLDKAQFVLNVKTGTFKRIRAALFPSLKKPQFKQNFLVLFLNAKKMWELNGDEEDEEEEDEDENEDEDEDEDEEDEEDDDDEEDFDFWLYKMTKAAKKSKKKEETALSRVTMMTLSTMKNWKKTCGTEEAFIDQHLYPFLLFIFLQDKKYHFTRSCGVGDILEKTSSEATTKTRTSKSISSAKPDFFVSYTLKDEDFGLLCVEVKKPDASVSQSLSDKSKLALETKRAVDDQALRGIQFPKCFGLLVDGLSVSSFVCELQPSGIYTFLELEEFTLLRGKSDLSILPDVVLSFCWLKTACSKDARNLVKPTVALPDKKSNSPK
ncbi:hypothetical protein EDC96DRAFT_607284 [Choanephora cucurbitarum]|nr:hypothetical protein EDC96DRAFT_607284 [Choanephora cucurbitarum]